MLGGARSGKSEIAEQLVEQAATALTGGHQGAGVIVYVATACFDGTDRELTQRIERHRARRGNRYATIETDPVGGVDLPEGLAAAGDRPALVDSLGTWLARHPAFVADVDGLLTQLDRRRRGGAVTVLVSDEVGLSVHPSYESGRAFRDALGDLNRRVADVADRVLLVVAGRVLPLDRIDPGA